jgi:hypothetical protein
VSRDGRPGEAGPELSPELRGYTFNVPVDDFCLYLTAVQTQAHAAIMPVGCPVASVRRPARRRRPPSAVACAVRWPGDDRDAIIMRCLPDAVLGDRIQILIRDSPSWLCPDYGLWRPIGSWAMGESRPYRAVSIVDRNSYIDRCLGRISHITYLSAPRGASEEHRDTDHAYSLRLIYSY